MIDKESELLITSKKIITSNAYTCKGYSVSFGLKDVFGDEIAMRSIFRQF
jgi:hypothetical protein